LFNLPALLWTARNLVRPWRALKVLTGIIHGIKPTEKALIKWEWVLLNLHADSGF